MSIGLYRTTSKGSIRAGELFLDAEGHAQLKVLDNAHFDFLKQLLVTGVDSPSKKRRVDPEDGPAFLEAVLETFQGAYWRARDDGEPAAASKGAARTHRAIA